MKNPPHPGLLIRDNIADLGLTVAECGAGLGATRQRLHNLINGKSSVSAERALRLKNAFGGLADMWLRMHANIGLALLRSRDPKSGMAQLMPRTRDASERRSAGERRYRQPT